MSLLSYSHAEVSRHWQGFLPGKVLALSLVCSISSFQLGYLYHWNHWTQGCHMPCGQWSWSTGWLFQASSGKVFSRDSLKSKSGWNATFLARSYYGNVEFNRISIYRNDGILLEGTSTSKAAWIEKWAGVLTAKACGGSFGLSDLQYVGSYPWLQGNRTKPLRSSHVPRSNIKKPCQCHASWGHARKEVVSPTPAADLVPLHLDQLEN